MKVTIVGLGYVGLVTALCFASRGSKVFSYEIDESKKKIIKNGTIPFYEPGLGEMLTAQLGKNFEIVDDFVYSNVYFVTVGTPNEADGSINLDYVKKASASLGKAMRDLDQYCVVGIKSTVVPGTTLNVVKPLLEKYSGKVAGTDFGLVMNPEFLSEGSAIKNTLEPHRVVVGEYDQKSGDVIEGLYRSVFASYERPILRTNIVNAEFIKYASNAFLASRISFMNTIANIAQHVPGADVAVIAKGMGLDDRIGNHFLNAGLGYGGSCFPKDVRALVDFSKEAGYNAILLEQVERINQAQPEVAIEKIREELGAIEQKTIVVLGLSFKPGTDDIRNAVSLHLISKLLKEKARVRVYDPMAMENVRKQFGSKVEYAHSAIEALSGGDSCIIATEWDEFRKLKCEDFVSRMRSPIIFDGRRIFNPSEFSNAKFRAIGLGPSK